ncbi:MAG: hypothetical protein ACI8P0_001889 [Planctomycetaceae bacterium]|jgi:hypothetical protein
MTEFSQMLNHPFVETLGWSLIHFLWQGTLLALVAAALLLSLKNASAALRYGVACLAFLLMAAAPAVTAWHLISNTAELANPEAVAEGIDIGDATQELNGSLVTDDSLMGTVPEPAQNAGQIPALGPLNAAPNSGLESASLRSWLTTLVSC